MLKLLLDFVFAIFSVQFASSLVLPCTPALVPQVVGERKVQWQPKWVAVPPRLASHILHFRHFRGLFNDNESSSKGRSNCGWREEDVSLYHCCYARARHGRWFLQQPFPEDSGAPALPTEVRAGLRFCARLIESAQGERSRIGAQKGSELAHQERHDWTERMPIKRSSCMRCHIFTGLYWRSCLER